MTFLFIPPCLDRRACAYPPTTAPFDVCCKNHDIPAGVTFVRASSFQQLTVLCSRSVGSGALHESLRYSMSEQSKPGIRPVSHACVHIIHMEPSHHTPVALSNTPQIWRRIPASLPVKRRGERG